MINVFLNFLKPNTLTMKNLEFRRQFLLSSIDIDRPENWEHIHIPHSKHKLILNFHPDLEITSIESQDSSLVLIGYIIDPFHPDKSNREILQSLIGNNGIQQIIQETENLSGRYAILFCSEVETCMFHDATGFREIYYSFHEGDIYCGSTPNIISRYANLEMDEDESINEFINSTEYRTSGFWIGTRTPFKQLHHLLPNFYLDLDKKMPYRYWPHEGRKEVDLKSGAELMARILKGTILAVSKRYELRQALTSGWDSRLLLAASKEVKNQTQFFVAKRKGLSDRSADIAIPKKLAKEYDFNLEVKDQKELVIDEDFKKIYYGNNIYARETFIRFFYDDFINKRDNIYLVTGTFSNEILRIAFPIKNRATSTAVIAKHFNYSKYSYAINSIKDWEEEATKVYLRNDYNLINMFYWEQYTGSWENLGASEGDIAREEIHPFNCRKFITTYISLKDRHRYKDYPMGHLMIIRILWKELLKIPTAAYKNKPNYWFKRLFRYLGIELMVNNAYNFIKNTLYYSFLSRTPDSK